MLAKKFSVLKDFGFYLFNKNSAVAIEYSLRPERKRKLKRKIGLLVYKLLVGDQYFTKLIRFINNINIVKVNMQIIGSCIS